MGVLHKAVAKRVLEDMLGSIQDPTGGGWKVLVLDDYTSRVLSSALKMSDVMDCNVSAIEDITAARESMPLAGVYFIRPTSASINQLISDFSGPQPLYPSVHVFFSGKLSWPASTKIRRARGLKSVLKTLKESSLEFLTVDSHTFISDNFFAPELLLGDQADLNAREGEKELDQIASRLCTALATLNEFPTIRYKSGKEPSASDPPGSRARSILTQHLATKLSEHVDAMQQAGQLPSRETCDVLILDRTFDAVAPFIHEWTYESLVYDLLTLEGNTYKHTVELNNGQREERVSVLDEHDSLWCELRHLFFPEAEAVLDAKIKDFLTKNKAAAKVAGAAAGQKGILTSKDVNAVIHSYPEFREMGAQLMLHKQIRDDLLAATNRSRTPDTQWSLTLAGELEQDLVLGVKTSADMLQFLTENHQHMTTADKVRLFVCYCATHPEQLNAETMATWRKAAKLSQYDMMTVTNICLLGAKVFSQAAPTTNNQQYSWFSFLGSWSQATLPLALRQPRPDSGDFVLNRFEPLLKEVVSDMAANRLPEDQFPYAPGSQSDASSSAQSARTGRTALTWTKGRTGDSGQGSSGRRLVVFVIGGVTRGEMRIAHELSKSLGREVILGSTTVETPQSYLDHLVKMNSAAQMYGA